MSQRRLNVEITEEQFLELEKHIPWGMRRTLVSSMLNCLIEGLRVNPQITIGGIITGRLKIVAKKSKER